MAASAISEAFAELGITPTYDSHGKPIWSLQVVEDDPLCQTHIAYFDDTTSKWRFDAGSSTQHNAFNKPPERVSRIRSATLGTKTISSLDSHHWTDALPQSRHTQFFRETDWTATPLGSFHHWGHALRLYVHMLFSDTRAGIVWWGPRRIGIYNEALLPFIGRLHPTLMGAQPEVSLERHGYLEETWWDATLIPLKNDRGAFGGAYFSWLDVTRTVLQDRRTALINRLGSPSPLINSNLVWQHIHNAFAESPRDLPMAIIYGVEDFESSNHRMHLKHILGVSQDYAAAPPILDLSSTDDNVLGTLFRRTRDVSTDYVVVDRFTDNIPSTITDHINWLGHNEPSRYLAVIRLQVKNALRGFIMVGLNPRREYDNDHETFVSDLVRQLRSLMTRIATEEESQKREEYLVRELNDSERRISKMAEEVPVGIYDLGADGSMLWADTCFFDIMGTDYDHRDPATFDWRDYIIPEDQEKANIQMGRCLMEKVKISDSLRLKKEWYPPGSARQQVAEPFWILYSASPDLKADGTVRSLMGCLTDISHLKWAEQLQARIADAAETEKRKQEESIDITSHEIRNPLSAITQCADSIIASFHDINNKSDARALMEIIKQNVEDAESILFCTVHQRRIINDILTLGKLDSGLLTVAPISFHPQSLVDEAMQMFKAEFEANQIDVHINMDQDSVLGAASSVRGDWARLMQVLVNLLTNAIKFTRTEEKRTITIRSGSSYKPPSAEMFGQDFHWNPTETTRPDLTLDAEYGTGDDVYLYYCVIDSGKGIPGEFANRVFSKFEQADRRTHTKYGGSGLGLFISRELTELQGGRIGVGSKEAAGSTFVFYTKAKCERNLYTNSIEAQNSRPNTTNTVDVAEAQKMENDSLYQPARKVQRSFSLTGNNYEVLLVEDNILNQKVLAKQLTKAGCVVHVANDGEEAVNFVLQSVRQSGRGKFSIPDFSVEVDCILMDWEMPVCDGLTATRRIREIEAQHGLTQNVIIGITANARPEQLAKAMEAGMNSIVPRPFRVPELLTKVGEHVPPREDTS